MAFTATFISEGVSVPYTPTSKVDAGDVVVQNTLVGIAKRDIEANARGALHVSGVFEVPKGTGDGGMDAGTPAYWDDSAGVATNTSTDNTLMGKVVTDADDQDTSVRVRLNQ